MLFEREVLHLSNAIIASPSVAPERVPLLRGAAPPPSEQRLFSNSDLRRLIIPLIIEQILAISVGMADTMMVSAAGEAAVSGVSLVDMVNVLLINVFAALATGGAVVTAQLIGARQQRRACESAMQLLLISVVSSTVIMTLALSFQRPLLTLLFGSITYEVMQNCLTYLWLSAVSYPFLAVYNACAALFRAMGNSKVSMNVSILMNVINVAGNALCVLGLRMGVAGVALPSLVSRAVAAVIMLLLLRNPRNEVHIAGIPLRVDFGLIRKILHIGIPNGFESGMFQLGRLLVVSIISMFGTAQIAANAVANNIDSLGCIPGQALGLAMITVVGQCVGAQDRAQVVYYTRKLLKIAYLLAFLFNAAILAGLPLLLAVYNVSPEARELATALIWIHNGLAILLWPLAFILPNALRAANDVRYTMLVSTASMWTFRIVFSYVLGLWLGLGALGVWIAMVLDWVCRIVFFLVRYRSGKWMRI